MTEAEIEAELARLDTLSDEEIIAEAIARGTDVVAQAERVRELLLEKARQTKAAMERLLNDGTLYKTGEQK